MAKSKSRKLVAKDPDRRNDSQLQVLLVEDSLIQQHCIAHMLKELGHEVTVTGDGFAALAALQRERNHDIVLMDCQMPLMDGLKATRFIRSSEITTGRHLVIIGMSATESAENCFEAGMDDFLRKPLERLPLKAALKRCIREKKDVD
jgi:hypothetical protein